MPSGSEASVALASVWRVCGRASRASLESSPLESSTLESSASLESSTLEPAMMVRSMKMRTPGTKKAEALQPVAHIGVAGERMSVPFSRGGHPLSLLSVFTVNQERCFQQQKQPQAHSRKRTAEPRRLQPGHRPCPSQRRPPSSRGTSAARSSCGPEAPRPQDVGLRAHRQQAAGVALPGSRAKKDYKRSKPFKAIRKPKVTLLFLASSVLSSL